MKYIDTLPELTFSKYIYRMSKTTPLNKGSIIIYPSRNEKDIFNFILDSYSSFMDTKFAISDIQHFYSPKKIEEEITGIKVNITTDQDTSYLNMKSNCDFINMTPQTPELLTGRNFIYNTSPILNVLFGKAKLLNPKVVMSILSKFFKWVDKATESGLYGRRYLIFDIGKLQYDITTSTDVKEMGYKTHTDILFYILYALKYNQDEALDLLKQYTLVFTSKIGIVKLNISYINNLIESGKFKGDLVARILMKINLLKSHKTGSDIMKDIVGDTENITKSEMDEINTVSDDMKGKDANILMNKVISVLPEEEKAKGAPLIDQVVNSITDESDTEKASKIIKDIKNNMLNREKKLSPKEEEYINSMKNLSINDKDIDEILNDMKNISMPDVELEHVSSISNIAKNKFINFNKVYDSQLRDAHLNMIGKHFSKCSVPIYMNENLKVEDTSNDMTLKDSISYSFTDGHGKNFKFTLDVPKLTKKGFLMINGQKTTLAKQLYSLPIVKVGEDVVITATYNKIFMSYRGGKYLSPNQSRLIRAIESTKNNNMITYGDVSDVNIKSSKTTNEYISLSKFITKLTTPNIDFIFNIEESISKYGDHYNDGYLVLGTYKDNQINLSLKDDSVHGDDSVNGLHLMDAIIKLCETDAPEIAKSFESISDDIDPTLGMSISELIISLSKTESADLYDSLEKIKTVPTSLASSYIKMMDRWLPLILVLSHTHGFFTVLERAKIKSNVTYKITIKPDDDGIKRRPKYNKYKQIMIETSDAYVTFDLNSLENIALLAPLTKMDLATYNLAALENRNYTSVILEQYSGESNLPLYIDIFKDVLIDPLTKEALLDHDLPTDFLDVFLYANMLLASGKHNSDINFNTKKIRHAEIITALVYNSIAKAYSEYAVKRKRGSKNAHFNIDKNIVMKELFELNTTAPYNSENPIEEQAVLSECSFKGLRGVNLEQAFNIKKRSFDLTHYGIVGLPSNYGPGVGVSKYLVAEPSVISPKGYMKTIDSLEDVKKFEMQHTMTTTELLNPSMTKHDNAQRIAMGYGQSSQILGVVDSSPNLITYGFDEALANLTEDFAFAAQQDGEVIGVDNSFIAVKYKDGTSEVFKLKRLERNASKAFYTENECIPSIKVKSGYKFKKTEILAHNKYFFKKNNAMNKTVFTDGPDALVVVHSTPDTFEDSTVLSESFAGRIGTFITNRYHIKLNKDYKINNFRMVGNRVKAGDVLMSFNKTTDDDFINSILGDSSSELNRIEKKSHEAGEIVSIRIYYTTAPDDNDSSINDFINNVRKYTEPKEVLLRKYGSNYDRVANIESPMKVNVGTKKNGTKIETGEILVEYYIKSFNIASIGNKVTYQAALKGIAATILPDDMMPFCEQSGRRADCILRTVSVGARQVYSVPILGVGSKGLRNLGKHISNLFSDVKI